MKDGAVGVCYYSGTPQPDAPGGGEVGLDTQVERLGLSEGAVWRLIDLDHRSYVGPVETALRALGKRLTVPTRAA